MRIWNLIVIISNVFHQIGNLGKIQSSNQIVVYIIYWLSVIIAGIMTLYSMKPGKLLVIKYAYMILLCRNIFRLFDIEKMFSEEENISLFQ